MQTLARLLAQTLAANGTELVFGIPGVHTLELYRGLEGSGLRHVTPRHEQGAGFMADGYARVSGRPGVCYLITGPGLTNAATAIAQAFADSVPMLIISTVNAIGDLASGRGHLHELPDQRQLMAQITAFSRTILTPTDLVAALSEAFALFSGGRPRPVHIEIPVDILAVDASRLGPARTFACPAPPGPRSEDIARARSLCEGAKKPVIVAGGGVARAGDVVAKLAEQLDAPVLMTSNARGLLPPGHPLAVSVAASLPSAASLLREADLLLALGTELGPTDFDRVLDDEAAPQCAVIRVDIDPLQTQRGLAPTVAIVADAGATARALARTLSASSPRGGADRAAKVRDAVRADLSVVHQACLSLLERLAFHAPNGLFVGDSTQLVYAGLMAFAPPRARSFFNSATGYGTLGYALPAAIGASLAAPGRQVFCLIGDGGIQFTLPEMGSAAEIGAAVTLILWNNNGYGEIRDAMTRADISPVGVDVLSPNFAALARGYGWRYDRAESLDALDRLLEQPGSGPWMIECDEEDLTSFARVLSVE